VRLRDDTVRRHRECASKITIQGVTIIPETSTSLSDAAWMKEQHGRAAGTALAAVLAPGTGICLLRVRR